jgi:hypothetical protein
MGDVTTLPPQELAGNDIQTVNVNKLLTVDIDNEHDGA